MQDDTVQTATGGRLAASQPDIPQKSVASHGLASGHVVIDGVSVPVTFDDGSAKPTPRQAIPPNRAQRRKWAHQVREAVRAAKRAKATAAT